MLFTLKNRRNLNSKNIVTWLFVAFFLIAPLFLTQQIAFAGQTGSQGGVDLNPNNRGNKPNLIDQQRQFAAAQMRYEQEPPSGNGELQGYNAPTRSNLSLFSLIAALFGGVWTLLILLRHGFAKRLEQNRARSPRFWEFALKPSLFLTERKTNMNMNNLKFINAGTLLVAVAFLVVPLLLPVERVFAGDPNCQSGYTANPYNNNPAPRTPTQTEAQFAAAQIRNEQNQPPRSRLKGGDSAMRAGFSFALSILVLLGGMWALLVLLRQRFGKHLEQKRRRLPKLLGFALKPSFALSAFALLFVAVIVGSVLTAPVTVTAEKREKREKPDKYKMTGLSNPSNKPVFKTAQQIGGGGITQIGSPVFDSAGNRYARGGFTETLTIGSTPLTASRYFDLFVAKYDQNGTAIWSRQATGATANLPAALAVEGATALAVDGSGNVYIGGSFVKTLVLQGGANANITLTDNGAAGFNYESFVAKYDQNGNLQWAKGGNSGSPKNADNLEVGQNGINQIVFDGGGNPYIAGFVSGNNFSGSSFTNQGQSEILLAKLNPTNGAVVWKQIIGGTDDDNGLDLKIDGSNNLYLIGNFGSPSITFPTTPATTFGNPDDPKDMLENSTNTFIAKFDAGGNNLWAKNLNNTDVIGGSQIAVGGTGDIYLTGYFFDSATFGSTTLTESEGSGEDEESLGGYVTKMDASGNFVWAKEFGGLGEGVALDGAGRIYIVGTFYDGGTFGADTANVETLASFGGEDIFVARYDSDGGFEWAKPIAGSGAEGEIAVGNPSDPNGTTENNYNPLGIAYNPARGTMFVSGDFQRAIALDCITLTTPGNTQSYIAEISGDSEPTSCRIWNGLDADNNNWNSPDNWNGGIVPIANDSVYVPYTGNNDDAPDYNPGADIPLSNLTIADDRILTLGRNLTVNTRLDLLGGFVDAESYPLLLGTMAQTFSISDGLILGRVQKQFAAGSAGAFTFPVGTAASDNSPRYSPVTLSNITGAGSFSVTANEGAYPNTTGLPMNRAARWWKLTNGGLTQTDLTFQYVAGDITQGTESQYRVYRISTGTAAQVNSTINTTTKTVTAPAVTAFSDWTLAQPVAPTAALVSVGGRVTDGNRRGIASATVSLTDANGQVQTARVNFFGFYQFEAVAAGQTYVFTVRSKRGQFAPQVVSVNEQINDLNFATR